MKDNNDKEFINSGNDDVLYSSDFQITTQDVPDELSLAISLSGCPLKCKGCHSSFTWDPKFGEPMTDEVLHTLIKNNKHISCVLFYGGEWKLKRLLELFGIVKSHDLKICLYTGLTLEEVKERKPEIINNVDYLKVGRYIAELGGLNKKATNQKMYRINQKTRQLEDITNKFFQS